MKEPSTIPDITSNTPSTDGSKPSDINKNGYKLPSNITDANKKPSVTATLKEPTVVDTTNLKGSENVKNVKVEGVDEKGVKTVIYEGELPLDGVVRNEKKENQLKEFKKVKVTLIEPENPAQDYVILARIHACTKPSTTAPAGKFEMHTFYFW